jgi:hypothetical protein
VGSFAGQLRIVLPGLAPMDKTGGGMYALKSPPMTVWI